MNKRIMLFIIIVLSILVLFLLLSSVVTVKENQYAYVSRFSKYIKTVDRAGLFLKAPFLDKVEYIPKNSMLYDIPPSEVLTADKKTIVVDNFTVWQIDDAYTYKRTVSGIPEIKNRINAIVYNAVKNTFSAMMQADIINSDSDSIDNVNHIITKMVNEQLKSYGVSAITVEVKRFDLPAANESAVFQRMISERKQMAEKFRADGNLEAQKMVNETNKQAGIILSKAKATSEQLKGEAEQEYMKIMQDAYGTQDRAEYYKFVRSLEALRNTIKGDKTLILSSDSYLVKVLTGTD